MEYSYEDVEKVINFSSWSDRKKIEELFRIDSYMYTNLGLDSLKKERDDVRAPRRHVARHRSGLLARGERRPRCGVGCDACHCLRLFELPCVVASGLELLEEAISDSQQHAERTTTERVCD